MSQSSFPLPTYAAKTTHGGIGPGAKWPADGAAIAEIAMTNKESAAIVPGTPVYLFAASQVKKARANAAGTARTIGLVKSNSIGVDKAGTIKTGGLISLDTDEWDVVTGGSGGLTAGAVYYLSAATAGRITATAPSTSTQYVQEIGVALSATTMQLAPRTPVVVA